MRKCKIDQLVDVISEELETYANDLNDSLKESATRVSRDCFQEIVANSPRRTGKYARSWRIKKTKETKTLVSWLIYNQKHYRLTHLLEKGTPTAKAIPHIGPAEKRAVDKFIKESERAVGK